LTDILLINGPNLNMLGTREPEIYGSDSLSDIENALKVLAKDNNVTISFMQSNAEHEIINKIQEAKKDSVKFILINPGPLTHTSIALRDTFLSTSIPFIVSLKEKILEKNHI
jgi:3-dehydroquinate dehydratase-2